MSTGRQAEGIKKAAEAVHRHWNDWYEDFRSVQELPLTRVRVHKSDIAEAAIATYLDHAFPEVTSAEELDAMPDGTIIRDADGDACQKDSDEEVQWWRILCIEDGWDSEEIHLPARVIHWGDQ